MLRRLALLAALLLAPAYLSAQTIVSGQVQDSSGLHYSGATLNITFTPSIGQPVILPSLALNYLGQFTTVITPPGSGTYTFAANFGGISPPIGTGPQTCTKANVTVSGGTQTVTFTGCPSLTNISGGGGGSPFVSLQTGAINGTIYVDGIVYPLTAAGIQSAINAAPVGGSVILPSTGGPTASFISPNPPPPGTPIPMGSTTITLPSGVCLKGQGPGFSTTLRWSALPTGTGQAGIYSPPGTFFACIQGITLDFASGLAAAGYRLDGNTGGGLASQYNTAEDVDVFFEGGTAPSGSVGIWGHGTSVPADVSINTFQNIRVWNAQSFALCSHCEGNHWSGQGSNLGVANQTLFSEVNVGDEVINVRLNSDTATGLTCFSFDSTSIISYVTLSCDDGTSGSKAISDAGTGNTFWISENTGVVTGTTSTSGTYTIAPPSGPTQFITPSIIVSGLTPGTSPTCPNGTGGALTTSGCSGGGGGGSPTGTAGTIQSTTGSAFSASNVNDNVQIPGSLAVNESLAICGANPWIDISCFGARPLTSIFTNNTASCNGTTTITLGTSLALVNGDGVVIYNCGATNVLTTPGAPTVTPSIMSGPDKNNDQVAGLTGATTYTYSILARDANGGLTAAGATGTTTTGPSALGAQQSTVTTMSRSGQTVTVNTTAANGAAVGGVVFITGSSDASFSGMYLVASTPTTTQFTYTQGNDSRAPILTGNINTGTGYSTNSATGGTAQVYNVNHLSWTAVSGAYQYYICVGSSLIGVTRPGETTWNDHGPTESARGTLPDFVPSSCPSAATNDYLATTVVSGGGTTTLIVANAASQTASGQTIKQDNGPNLLAAFAAATASGKSTIHVPATPPGQSFFFNSHVALSGSASLEVIQSGAMVFNETLDMTGISDAVKWTGRLGGSSSTMPQFGFNSGQTITANAYPGIIFPSPASIREVAVTFPAQGLGIEISGTLLFNSSVENSSFIDVSTGDYMGESVVINGGSNVSFRQVTSSVNDALPFGYSLTPSVLMRNEVNNANAAGRFTCDHCYFAGRGFGENGTSVISAQGQVDFESPYMQAGKNPTIMMGKFSLMNVKINNGLQDTTSMPILTMLRSQAVLLTNTTNTGNETAGAPGLISGVPVAGLVDLNGGNAPGQNRDMPLNALTGQTLQVPTFSATGALASGDLQLNAPTHFPAPYTLYWDLPAPATATATGPASATSTLPTGSWTYRISAIGLDGGATKLSVSSSNACVVTTTNQTCTVTWPADAGAAKYTVWGELGVGGWGQVPGCVNITALTCTQTAITAGGVVPTDTGTGTTGISATGIYTLQLRQTVAGQWATTGTMTGGTFVFTFPVAYVVAPVCVATDTTAVNAVMAATSTTAATMTGTSGDNVAVICVGNPN